MERQASKPNGGSGSVIVVGGGIVGSSAAFRLRQAGLDVILLDCRRPTPPASFGNAGHIATEQGRPFANPATLRSVPRQLFAFGGALDMVWRQPWIWAPWAVRAVLACGRAQAGQVALESLLAEALGAWRRFSTELGQPELFAESGHLMVWHDPVAARAGMRDWLAAASAAARARPLDAAELRDLGRGMATAPCAGLRFEGTAQSADPALVMAAIGRAFEQRGGRRIAAAALRLVSGPGRIGVVLADGQTLRADRVLVAAGVGSKRLLRSTGVRLPLIAERGYHVEWPQGGAGPQPPLVFEERALIVSRFGQRLRASSFVEFGHEDAAPDERKFRRLEAHVRELGLPAAGPSGRWMGARPTLPDYLPAIGASAAMPGLFVACGHQHLGLTLAPLTAELVAAEITGASGTIPLAPFSPDRFARLASHERAA